MIAHHSMISFAFMLFLSFGLLAHAKRPATSRRKLKEKQTKSPQSPKLPKYLQLPKETCLVTGYVIAGTTVLQTGDTFNRINEDCSTLTGTAYDECFLENYLETAFVAPFQYVLDGSTDTLQFTTDEALLGVGSLKGSIPSDTSDRFDKIILTFVSSPYIQGVNDELWNRPVSDFEYIEYSFKAEACNGVLTQCPSQFYLNVYTRSDAAVTDFYSCRYDYVPTTGGVEGGDWTTLRFEIGTTATTARSGSGTTKCPAVGAATLQNAADNGYVLGTNEQYPPGTGQIFALNMGDTSLTDAGLIGYFDRIVVKLQGEDPRVFDLEPAV